MIKNQQQANPEEAAIPAFLRPGFPGTLSAKVQAQAQEQQPARHELDTLDATLDRLHDRISQLEDRLTMCLRAPNDETPAVAGRQPAGGSALTTALYSADRKADHAIERIERLMERIEV